jgi:hypothetical protein
MVFTVAALVMTQKISKVGRDGAAVRRYIQAQEKEDQRMDQLALMPL